MKPPEKLLNFDLLGLCLIGMLAFCNITVFYNLFPYLQTLGIPSALCGLVVGAYSLTAMLLFLVVSPFLEPANSPRTMLIGMAILVVSGFSYLGVHGFWGLLLLRVINGLGQFLLGASVMAMLVTAIPTGKSGQAFGLYSVAVLLPYGLVPTCMEMLNARLPSPAHGYALATLVFLPAAWIVLQVRRRQHQRGVQGTTRGRPAWHGLKANLRQHPIVLLIVLNLGYFVLWSSLFFLFKGFAAQQGLANVGRFFAVQTGLMIILRLLAGRLFDLANKVWLAVATFSLLAVGYLALDHLPDSGAIPLVALLFGLAMGAGYPAINGLMFEVSAPEFRALNANLMGFAVQGGFFFGPAIGGAIVAHAGYHGYFLASALLAAAAATLSGLLLFSWHRRSIRPASPDRGLG